MNDASAGMFEEIHRALLVAIKNRLRNEVRPLVDRIVDEETAAFALTISRWIKINELRDSLLIEIKKIDIKNDPV